MKLSEALNERADLQKRIAQLSQRLNANAKAQEGDKPSEDPVQLLEELKRNCAQLESLITRINLTNSKATVGEDTLTALIAKKDVLTQRIAILRSFLAEASARVDRYSNKEIKIYSTVDVAELQKSLDQYAKQLRELDTRIQGANWTVDLL